MKSLIIKTKDAPHTGAIVARPVALHIPSSTCASDMGSDLRNLNNERPTFSTISSMVDLEMYLNTGDLSITSMRYVKAIIKYYSRLEIYYDAPSLCFHFGALSLLSPNKARSSKTWRTLSDAVSARAS
jgi:hypothetical protein